MSEETRPDYEHRGAFEILGEPATTNRVSWLFQAGKSVLACFLALLLDLWLGNPDHVTSTFVAVLCISPVVLLGVRRAWDQLVGSLLGGLWGTAMALLGLPLLFGIPLAVGGGILSSLLLGFGRGYALAAFTALFVQAVPWGTPLETLENRILAVGIGVASAFVVNVVVSASAYRSIFERRLRFAEATVSRLLADAAEQGPISVRHGFTCLVELEADLRSARGELTVRRAGATQEWIEAVAERVEALRRLLHLVLDLAYRLQEEGLPPDAMAPWLRWLMQRGGTEPEVPPALRATTRRIRALGRALRDRSALE